MSAKIRYIPVWKRDATAPERLAELAQVAAEKPQEFSQLFVIWVEKCADGNTILRTQSAGCSTHEALGMLTAAQMDVYLETRA